MKVIVIGGGWAGCSAAITAKKAGAQVILYEKTDMLIGLGNVGGIMRNNGRYTAAAELINLGAGDLINITDKNTRHKNIDFPGHNHAWLYDVNKIEPDVRDYLKNLGIEINFMSRVVDIEKQDKTIRGIYLSDGTYVKGDVFIEATGSTDPMGNCLRYGNGCSMCILRCPSFGPRVSISTRAGVEDLQGEREDDVYGAFSGSCKLCKESLSEDLLKEIEEKGSVVLKVPPEDVNLDKLRKIKGLEKAKYIDPYAGGKANSIRYLSVAPRRDSMKVKGIDNLFCAGEKSGLFVGHTEAMCTGALAGHNAVRHLLGMPLLILPKTLAIGDLISYANFKMATKEGRRKRYTFAGAEYFDRMKNTGLYSTDNQEIVKRVEKLNLLGIMEGKMV
ncbi:FAD-dependent oxidoreductase [Clostridium tetani]|uniref:FAD-dependent oxidoreductase n=2 Tax=Clostridium tetani TaxID=1513 RepID=UPI001025610D|nr:FAD-dependent oxidoreductase [Clostridium tetani]RXI69034.1 FAD-dependent oxidoreductase [Clostridium tetani]